jgi:hypothetical protein
VDMNKLTALTLLKITKNPHYTIIVIGDSGNLIKTLREELINTGHKNWIKGYTKERLLTEQGGAVFFVNKKTRHAALCGARPDQIIFEGKKKELTPDDILAIYPIVNFTRSEPILKYVLEEFGDIPEHWIEGFQSGNVFFTEYD